MTPSFSSNRTDSAAGGSSDAGSDAGVLVEIGADPRRLAGAGALDRPRLYAPNPTEPGSSISHWDTGATPNLLMEPDLNDDLPHEVDLTLPLLRDIGWRSDTVPETQDREAPDGAEAERSPQTVDRP